MKTKPLRVYAVVTKTKSTKLKLHGLALIAELEAMGFLPSDKGER